MRWITRENVKVDRVACPWLIRRFVDPVAEFLFVPESELLATATRERCEWRGPDVDLAVLGEVADRPDGEIDGAVDFAEPGAALTRPGGVDDVEELQCCGRRAALAVTLAQGKLHHFVVEAALHAEPFVAQSAGGEGRRGKPERLGRARHQFYRRGQHRGFRA